MRRSSLRIAPFLAAAVLVVTTGCGGGSSTPSPGSSPGGGDTGKTYRIGIAQIVTHPSLDAARDGFKQGLQEAGINATFDEQNAQGDQATVTSIASTFKSANLDLVLAIATPTAQATAQAITDKPILFTAVTDPAAAKLVGSMESPGANVTGTTDMNPVADQIKLVKQVKPDAKTVGIVYSSGEVNSQIQVDLAKKAAAENGLTIVEKTITATAELQQAANSVKADAFYVPTDNNVVSGLGTLIQVAESNKVPVIASDAGAVGKGAALTYGIDYVELGKQTAQMASRILKDGANPSTMPVESLKNMKYYVNRAAAEKQGITIPADIMSQATAVG